MNTNKDYYAVLGVPYEAAPQEIKIRFRQLCKLFHPDRFNDDSLAGIASEKFREIREAYEILSDPEKRRRYDEMRNAGGSEYSSGPSRSHEYDPNYDAYMQRIKEMCRARRWRDVVNLCEEAIRIDDRRWEAFGLKAMALSECNYFDEAETQFELAVQRGPDEGFFFNGYGCCLLELKKFDKAVYQFKKAIRLDGEAPLYLSNLAIAYELSGNREEARRGWDEVKRVDPNNALLKQREQAVGQPNLENCAACAGICAVLECIFNCC